MGDTHRGSGLVLTNKESIPGESKLLRVMMMQTLIMAFLAICGHSIVTFPDFSDIWGTIYYCGVDICLCYAVIIQCQCIGHIHK